MSDLNPSIILRVVNRADRAWHLWTTKGNAVSCNCCNWEGSSFWKNPSRNICPRCGSPERYRFLLYALDHLVDSEHLKNQKLLEFAPFPPIRPYFNTLFETVTTADIVPGRGDLVVDMCHMKNIADSSFGALMAFHVLEHVADDQKALREIYRILEPGGTAILCVPICQSTTEPVSSDSSRELQLRAGYPVHVRACGTDYYRRIEEAGFTVRTLNPWDLPRETRLRFGLTSNNEQGGAIYWCTKHC